MKKQNSVKTPSYWSEEVFQPLVMVETRNGNIVKIPRPFTGGWEIAKVTADYMEEKGEDLLEGLSLHPEDNQLFCDLYKVYLEVYEE